MQYIIYERIKELRQENGINQKKLAELCEVKQSCVSRWEKGDSLPDTKSIIKLCIIFDESADYLLGLKDY